MFDNINPTNHESPPRRILVAEDNNSVRRFIEIILQRANFEVLTTNDGLEALKAASEINFDAVVADAMMPNLTGYDLFRILRQNPTYQNTPLILLSGFEQDGELEFADAYLLKENNIKEVLLQTISTLIARKELQVN
ncbi:MAG TPA: response regulator [Pyrinomonadaceae bacterium]|nr:response regulator [Pyrinomonadaceae bacterium]